MLALVCAGLFAHPAEAKVRVSFHSFNGSVLFGRYPHTFVVFEGTLDDTGQKIEENFGFTAKTAGPAVLNGPVQHLIWVEEAKWIGKTNRHFTLTVDDAAVHGVEAPLWTETITTLDDIEHMLLPRLPAVAERAWSAATTRDWVDFRDRLAAH